LPKPSSATTGKCSPSILTVYYTETDLCSTLDSFYAITPDYLFFDSAQERARDGKLVASNSLALCAVKLPS